MTEEQPTPISRGVEIQREKIEQLQEKAINRYNHIVELDKELERKISIALAEPVTDQSIAEMANLFEKKHALDTLGNELEELILKGFQLQDEARERWVALEQRISEFHS